MDYNIIQGACTLTNSGDNFVGKLPINIATYVNNGLYLVRAPITNTTTIPTLNLNGLGAVTITTNTGAPLQIGQMLDSGWYLVMYSSSNRFLLITTEFNASIIPINGSGTNNYVSKFITATTIGNTQIQDDGNTIGINNAPQSLYKTYINSDKIVGLGVFNNAPSGNNNLFGVSGSATNANTGSNVGVFGNALLSSNGTNLGVRGQSTTNQAEDSHQAISAGSNVGGFFQANKPTGISYGIVASADANSIQSSATFIGAYIRAVRAGTKYAVQLQDDTEGTGKFLKSVTADGKANWASLGIADITTSFGTALQVVRVNALATALEYATLPVSVIKVGTAVYTPNATIATGRVTVNKTVTGAVTTDFVVINMNDNMRADFVAAGGVSHYFLDVQAYVSATNTVTLTYMLNSSTTFGANSSINLMVQR